MSAIRLAWGIAVVVWFVCTVAVAQDAPAVDAGAKADTAGQQAADEPKAVEIVRRVFGAVPVHGVGMQTWRVRGFAPD